MVFLFANIIEISKYSLKSSEMLNWLRDWYSLEEKKNCVGFFFWFMLSEDCIQGKFNCLLNQISEMVWQIGLMESREINTSIQL